MDPKEDVAAHDLDVSIFKVERVVRRHPTRLCEKTCDDVCVLDALVQVSNEGHMQLQEGRRIGLSTVDMGYTQ